MQKQRRRDASTKSVKTVDLFVVAILMDSNTKGAQSREVVEDRSFLLFSIQ